MHLYLLPEAVLEIYPGRAHQSIYLDLQLILGE